jgi:hypothetical protein
MQGLVWCVFGFLATQHKYLLSFFLKSVVPCKIYFCEFSCCHVGDCHSCVGVTWVCVPTYKLLVIALQIYFIINLLFIQFLGLTSHYLLQILSHPCFHVFPVRLTSFMLQVTYCWHIGRWGSLSKIWDSYSCADGDYKVFSSIMLNALAYSYWHFREACCLSSTSAVRQQAQQIVTDALSSFLPLISTDCNGTKGSH